jgi:hypothetical protein
LKYNYNVDLINHKGTVQIGNSRKSKQRPWTLSGTNFLPQTRVLEALFPTALDTYQPIFPLNLAYLNWILIPLFHVYKPVLHSEPAINGGLEVFVSCPATFEPKAIFALVKEIDLLLVAGHAEFRIHAVQAIHKLWTLGFK